MCEKAVRFDLFRFLAVTLLLALITLSFANTIVRPNAECTECKNGVPDVPVDIIVTPPPTSDDCAEGRIDVGAPLPPITPAPPPPC